MYNIVSVCTAVCLVIVFAHNNGHFCLLDLPFFVLQCMRDGQFLRIMATKVQKQEFGLYFLPSTVEEKIA